MKTWSLRQRIRGLGIKQRRIDKFDQLDVSRICIIKPSALGDVVQATAILEPLRRRFPGASISWVIKDSLRSLLEGYSQIDHLIAFPDKRWFEFGLFRELRRQRFDLVLDLQGLFRSGVMTRCTGARWRIGLETSREGASLSYNRVLSNSNWDRSAFARVWRVAEACGVDAEAPPTYAVERGAAAWALQELRRLPRPLLAVCPGTRWRTKQWPAQNFAEVVAGAVRQTGCGVALIGSASEMPLAVPVEQAVQSAGGRVANLVSHTTIPRLAAVLSQADCLLSNDSGAMHLADAVGTRVTSVFTSTTPAISGPIRPSHRLISTSAVCGGCYKKECPLSERPLNCHDQVDAQSVLHSVVGQLMAPQVSRRA